MLADLLNTARLNLFFLFVKLKFLGEVLSHSFSIINFIDQESANYF